MRVNRITAAALTGAAVVLVGGGTALAGQAGDENRSARCEERVAKLAEERGVSVAELEAGIKARLSARIDAALASGRVTPERAARLKERIAAGRLCQGAHVRVKREAHALLRRAADFLGLTKAELRAELPGTSLGALALERGKSVESLEAALLAPAMARLAKAVEAGRITRAQADRRLEQLERRIDRLVARAFSAG
ncbi:MAG: hypothetical protein WD380_05170 [Gaiellaceae bacterium]